MDFILEQAAGAGPVAARKMFGEYGLYLDGKVVALICDGQLFLKPTPGARAAFPDAAEGPPYPGAKPHLCGDELLDDPDRLAGVLRAIAADVPEPKPAGGRV
ncbi:MAG: TfoX/Sxy family protein [Paracoccaceae bacterium]